VPLTSGETEEAWAINWPAAHADGGIREEVLHHAFTSHGKSLENEAASQKLSNSLEFVRQLERIGKAQHLEPL
jgi:hypothetical protein